MSQEYVCASCGAKCELVELNAELTRLRSIEGRYDTAQLYLDEFIPRDAKNASGNSMTLFGRIREVIRQQRGM